MYGGAYLRKIDRLGAWLSVYTSILVSEPVRVPHGKTLLIDSESSRLVTRCLELSYDISCACAK